MELTTHPRKLSRWRILPTMSSRGSWKVPVTVQSPGFGTSQSTRRMAGHWACLFGLTTTREAWLTRRHSLAPLEPDAIMHQVHRFEVCVLLGGKTGDGSCLGPVRPRPLDGPFGPPRAGALAPCGQCRRPGILSGPELESCTPPCPIRRLGGFRPPSSEDAGDLPIYIVDWISKYPFTHAAPTARFRRTRRSSDWRHCHPASPWAWRNVACHD
jgi:hypothetical protein